MISIKTSHLIHVKQICNLSLELRRNIMNCAEYENVGIEESTGKLKAVPSGQALGERIARRVSEVLDAELAHGSMPA